MPSEYSDGICVGRILCSRKISPCRTVFPLYRISYMWYTFFGAMVSIIVAGIWTCIFGGNDPADVDPSLLTPWIRNRFQRKVSEID